MLASFARDLRLDIAFLSEGSIGELPAREMLAIMEPAFKAFNDAVVARQRRFAQRLRRWKV